MWELQGTCPAGNTVLADIIPHVDGTLTGLAFCCRRRIGGCLWRALGLGFAGLAGCGAAAGAAGAGTATAGTAGAAASRFDDCLGWLNIVFGPCSKHLLIAIGKR